MFERFTESARRVVFFARFEASEYGSLYIEIEHLLLGLFRDNRSALPQLLGPDCSETGIRAEINLLVTRREPIPVSIEIPLTNDAKTSLTLASKESQKFGQAQTTPEHILLGILGVPGSRAAKMLVARGITIEGIRAKLLEAPPPQSVPDTPSAAKLAMEDFLNDLRNGNSLHLRLRFAKSGMFVDADGKAWNKDAIEKEVPAIFASYAKKNAVIVTEQILADGLEAFVATVLVKNPIHASERRTAIHRVSLVLVPESDGWAILLAQVTPIHFESQKVLGAGL
jgi:hypothetical protein